MNTCRVVAIHCILACAVIFSGSASAKTAQTINFPNPGSQSFFGTPPTLAATATSTLPVTYTSRTASVCTVTTAGVLTYVTTGNCTIRAAQAGDAIWAAATNVDQTFNISNTIGFDPDLQPTGWVGEVTVSKFSFAAGDATLYKPDYGSPNWSGNLFAFPVSAAGVVDFTRERWNGGAAARLNLQNKTNNTWNSSGRAIVTHNGTSAVPFLWATTTSASTMTSAQQASLGDNTTGPKVLNYVRGDFSNEAPSGVQFRPRRTTVLGDIIHSRPAYVPDTANPRIYVGANDGMLHVFNATTGDEVFAYIPSLLISKLKDLTVDADPFVHEYYVDASPTWKQISSTQKVLVGGLGAGGRGLYALDISNPPTAETETSAKARILWEITNATTLYADLGQTYGRPVIGKISTGAWAAIVGNGYNGTARSVLYVINVTTGAQIAKLTTSVGTGLSSPTAIDADGDGVIDYVYAGDIDGNLWKFDLTSTSTGSWTSTKLFTTTLKATTAQAQAITGAPSVRPHPSGAGYMVTFGSGRMFTTADAADATSVAYVYGIWDNGTAVTNINNLVNQTLTAKTFSTATKVRTSSSNSVDWTAKQGWVLALPAGERVVGDGGFISPINGLYTFSTTNPTVTHAASNGITQPKGENWLVEILYDTGGAPKTPVFDMNADGSLNSSDLVTADSVTPANPATGVPVSRLIAFGVLSQPLEAQTLTASKTYFNANVDLVAPDLVTGVPGGHFDFDIWYNCAVAKNAWSCGANDHTHEYDEQYHVSGVNMLNPSKTNDNLSNAPDLTNSSKKLDVNSTKPFKILLLNQKLSPAVEFKVGSDTTDAYVRVTDYGTSANLAVASLPTYSRAGVSGAPKLLDLVVNMPLNTFTARNWATDLSTCTPPVPYDSSSTCRVGLVPTETGCVKDNGSGTSFGNPQWMDGALTIQIIDTATADSDIQLADTTLGSSMGYRLKNTSITHLIAQYTVFWHSAKSGCMADASYNPNPPIDTSADTTGDPPAGTGDPSGGFNAGGNVGGTNSSQMIQQYFVDGTQLIITATRNGDGSISVTYTYSDQAGNSSGNAGGGGGGGQGTPDPTNRGSWKLVVRPPITS